VEGEVVGLGRYAAAVRRRGWVVVAITLLFAVAAFAYTATRPAQYSATAQVLIRPYSAAQYAEPVFTTEQVATQVAVMQSLSVAAPVVAKLGLDETPSTLLKSVSASAVGDTSVISVTVTRGSPQLAALIANAIGRSYLDFRAAGQPAGAKNRSSGIMISSAQPSPHPSSRSAAFGGVLGGVIGLVLGCILAIVLDARDKSIKDEATLADVTGGLPVLGRIPKTKTRTQRLASVDNPGSREVLAYRFLATTLRAFDRAREPRGAAGDRPTLVLVASAAPGDGRTAVAANVAFAASVAGQRVLLCDADLTNPRLTRLLGLPSDVTFDRVLRGSTSFDRNRLAHPAPGLMALGTQEMASDTPAALGHGELPALLASLATVVDMVVLDTSPLLSSAEALELLADADIVLFVVRERSTKRADVTAALDRVRQIGGSVSGVVVTRSSVSVGTQRPSRRRASAAYASRSASTPVATAASAPPTDLSRR